MTLALRPLSQPLRLSTVLAAPLAPRTWTSAIQVVLDWCIGLAAFTVSVTLVSTAGGLAVTIVLAIPVLFALFGFLRVLGKLERARYASLLDTPIADPYRPGEGSFWERVRSWVTQAAPWKELVYSLVLFPIATVGLSLVLVAWAGSLALVLLPAYVGALPDRTATVGWIEVHQGGGAWLVAAVGLVGLFVAPWITQGWGRLDVAFGRALLGRTHTEALEERVSELETTRSWAVEIAEAERRRIERDLHDGAQQRLVALAMDLGLAQEHLDDDPARARALVEHAHEEAKRAIAELRDLARGIHPVSLSDRGLPGAIPALAGRCPIPVDVHVAVAADERRPPTAIEGMAYFIVSECLANAVKHASATRASVRIEQRADRLVVDVTDDGIGGADPALGTGLHGLADRAASVDGTFTVDSPVGGPTLVHVELPCAS
ncbi:MAG: sensor histidine kinase [Acidimicrobiales bacterium]